MASTNKTTNLLLNSWTATDTPIRTDFNADNTIVDNAFGAALSTLTTTAKTIVAAINELVTSIGTKQKTITYGTSAPSGGSDGDIYIQY